ncbi:MAG: Rpn family recombination-promoting nuclease/putative transposase [Treponema sp.]|jgi:predicted transposase/invertase (TIGR01784 family)|nr:Rpn family recombination-promoting nuclease/putative transposase [Treponema sp.]
MSNLPMDADILPPSDDRIFKVLLTHPDAKRVLIDIISVVIDQNVIDVKIRGNEVPVMDINEKNERFDVNCTIDSGDQVDVEMHSCRQDEIGSEHTNFINKYVYFLTDLHSSQKSKKVIYRNLVKTYQITFCMYNILPSTADFVNRFSLRTENNLQLTDQINIIIIELGKLNKALKKPVDELTSFEKWSLFLRYAQEPMQRKLINDIIKCKEEIGMAAALLQEISQDEHERARIRSRKMYEMDQYSNLHTSELRGEIRGEAKGRERGRTEGMIEGRDEIIKLLEKGYSLEEIKKMLEIN